MKIQQPDHTTLQALNQRHPSRAFSGVVQSAEIIKCLTGLRKVIRPFYYCFRQQL